MSEADILREALTKLLRGAGVAKLGLARDGVQHAKLVQMEGIATTALAAPRDTGTEAVLEDAIAFIESLAVVPLLMSDDIEMRLQDVQAHARVEAASLRKRLTDRSTRPAEPAAPVAEAGDGEVRAIETRDVWKEQDVWENLIHTATQHFGHGAVVEFLRREFEHVQAVPMVRLSTLEAERARADELRRERDFWENRENEALHRLAAAEQRAADALARAEKAEGALETAREDERDRLYGIALKDMEGRSMRAQHSHSAALWLRLEGAMDTYSRLAARSATTETATDGGDNE